MLIININGSLFRLFWSAQCTVLNQISGSNLKWQEVSYMKTVGSKDIE